MLAASSARSPTPVPASNAPQCRFPALLQATTSVESPTDRVFIAPCTNLQVRTSPPRSSLALHPVSSTVVHAPATGVASAWPPSTARIGIEWPRPLRSGGRVGSDCILPLLIVLVGGSLRSIDISHIAVPIRGSCWVGSHPTFYDHHCSKYTCTNNCILSCVPLFSRHILAFYILYRRLIVSSDSYIEFLPSQCNFSNQYNFSSFFVPARAMIGSNRLCCLIR